MRLSFLSVLLSSGAFLLGSANAVLAQNGTDVATVTSTYEVRLLVDFDELNKNPRYQALKQSSSMSEEDLVSQIRLEAEQSLKLELVSLGTAWEKPDETSLLVNLNSDQATELKDCFPPQARWLIITVDPTNKVIDAQVEKFQKLKVEQKEHLDQYIGLTYKQAVALVRESETVGNEMLCRLVSVDGLLLVNPYASKPVNYTIINFEVEGGRIVKVSLLLGPK